MVEPLQKRRADGSPYRRRREVEEELRDLEELTLADVLAQRRVSRMEDSDLFGGARLHPTTRSPKVNTHDPGSDGRILSESNGRRKWS